MNKWLDFIRGIVRPVIALGGIASVGAMVIFNKPVPDAYLNMVLMFAAYYFGTRTSKS